MFLKIVKWAGIIFFGLVFINAGLDKFLHYMPVPELEEELMEVGMAIMKVKWLFPLVACVEITSGILFIIPKTRPLAALMILPILTGILLQNIFYSPEYLPIPVTLWIIELSILYTNRMRYKALVQN